MSDEIDIAKGTGLGAAAVAILGVLWGAFLRKGEKAEDKIEAQRDAKMLHIEARLQGISDDYKDRLRFLELKVENIDTRLKSREGLQGLQHTGVKRFSDEEIAFLNKIKESADE